MVKRSVTLALAFSSAILWKTDAQSPLNSEGFVPFGDKPINYLRTVANDPVAELQQRIVSGDVDLTFDPGQGGYLRSLLEHLRIPISSQVLVFSKTSLQSPNVSTNTPRAIYFNDDVYVGWVQGGLLEIASLDPMQGAMFYTLENGSVESPQFQRASVQCMSCHVSAATRGIPGVLVRSVHSGLPLRPESTRGLFLTGHEVPIAERWGGWYVTGNTGRQLHKGAAVSATTRDLSPYLSDNSDVVAHLVLDHQTQMHNLITLTNYQTRLALHADSLYFKRPDLTWPLSNASRKQYESAAELLLRYMLFVNEAPLADRITGTSGFAEAFIKNGPRDPKGRSLRDLNLRSRTFEYPCSFLIYSKAFDALPTVVKEYIYRRLYEILTEQDNSRDFTRLKRPQRRAILEILQATKKDFPQDWFRSARNLQICN